MSEIEKVDLTDESIEAVVSKVLNGISPTKEMKINRNGNYNVRDFGFVKVDVPQDDIISQSDITLEYKLITKDDEVYPAVVCTIGDIKKTLYLSGDELQDYVDEYKLLSTKTITDNGTYDVKEYGKVIVSVNKQSELTDADIIMNMELDADSSEALPFIKCTVGDIIKKYYLDVNTLKNYIISNYITQTKTITSNGTYDVTDFATIKVQVADATISTSNIIISSSLVTDSTVMTDSEIVTVNVKGTSKNYVIDLTPYKQHVLNNLSKKQTVVKNGTYDVRDCGQVEVTVPASAVDTGTKTITANGDYDVIGKALVNVNVPEKQITPDDINIKTNFVTVNDSTAYTYPGSFDITVSNASKSYAVDPNLYKDYILNNLNKSLVIRDLGSHDVREYRDVQVDLNVNYFTAGTKDITSNGTYDIKSYRNVTVNVPKTEPTGVKELLYYDSSIDVKDYAYVSTLGLKPSGTKNISYNGEFDVSNFEKVNVNVNQGIIPSGVKTINDNGQYDISSYATALVEVTADKLDSGSLTITENKNDIDVIGKATVNVNVPASAVDTGSITVTKNSTYDVTGKASVVVNVPASNVTSGTKTLTTNGTYDVTDYKNAEVKVWQNVVNDLGKKELTTYDSSISILDYTHDIDNAVDIYNVYTSLDASQLEPKGTLTITENGSSIDVKNYAYADVNITADKLDSGTLEIIDNGDYDVIGTANVKVNVPADKVDSGTLEITENGTKGVIGYAKVIVNIPTTAEPSGTLEITENGEHDVTNYANVNVVVEKGIFPTGNLEITKNGEQNVTQYATVNVNVPASEVDEGTLDIITNGNYDVVGKANVEVNVPIGITPEGSLEIDTNGEFDVTNYAKANVNIEQGVFPTGTLEITQNGTYSVPAYENVEVNVENEGITPEGTLTITDNGDYDITNYSNVVIRVPQNYLLTFEPQSSEYGSWNKQYILLKEGDRMYGAGSQLYIYRNIDSTDEVLIDTAIWTSNQIEGKDITVCLSGPNILTGNDTYTALIDVVDKVQETPTSYKLMLTPTDSSYGSWDKEYLTVHTGDTISVISGYNRVYVYGKATDSTMGIDSTSDHVLLGYATWTFKNMPGYKLSATYEYPDTITDGGDIVNVIVTAQPIDSSGVETGTPVYSQGYTINANVVLNSNNLSMATTFNLTDTEYSKYISSQGTTSKSFTGYVKVKDSKASYITLGYDSSTTTGASYATFNAGDIIKLGSGIVRLVIGTTECEAVKIGTFTTTNLNTFVNSINSNYTDSESLITESYACTTTITTTKRS